MRCGNKLLGAMFIALAVAIAMTFRFTASPSLAHDQLLPIRIAVDRSLAASLIWDGKDHGFFEQAGLQTDLVTVSFGKQAIEAVLRGEADLGLATGYVVAKMAPTHPDLRILATAAICSNIRIITLTARNVRRPADLSGMRIGVSAGSLPEYLLDRVLTLENVPRAAVERIDLVPSDMVRALSDAQVDAVITWEPHVQEIVDKFGAQTVVIDSQPGQQYYFVLAGRSKWIAEHRNEVERVLAAMQHTTTWAGDDPEAFSGAQTQRLKGTLTATDATKSQCQFSIGLPGALVTSLSEQQRWIGKTSPGTTMASTDVLELIDAAPLRAISPSSVTVAP